MKFKLFSALGFSHKGCYRDSRQRTLPVFIGNFPKSQLIVKCYQEAKARSYKAFGCQNKKECFTGPKAHNDYNKLGKATNCQNGVGGGWAQDIYFIT